MRIHKLATALGCLLLMFSVSAQANTIGGNLTEANAFEDPQIEATYLKNRDWAIVLGKALFWDTKIGSDGVACGSCHFHAGSDARTKNQLNPGVNGFFDPTRTGGGGPNYPGM